MSENVKINIIEQDKTSPAGRGTDSTDIAYVPGFSVLSSAPKNIPTLVTSTQEFEQIFGTKPVVLTNKDVEEYSAYGFMPGDVDRSYVYAKELLLQGMPVVYSNIVPRASSKAVVIEENDEIKKSDNEYIVSSDINNVTITAEKALKSNDFTFEFVVDLTSDKKSTTSYDLILDVAYAELVNYRISKINDTTKNIVLYDDTRLDYINRTSLDDMVKATIEVTLKVDLDADEFATVAVRNRTSSILDGFYNSEKATIGSQWAISTAKNPVINTIADKSVYSVKYITSGGYPSVVSGTNAVSDKFAFDMIEAAKHRGDAVALIDYQLNLDEKAVFSISNNGDSFYSKMQTAFSGKDEQGYGTAMYPWATYNCGASLSKSNVKNPMISMPASFGYLMCVAKSIKSSPNWLAMAGVSRGLVPSISNLLVPGGVISNSVAEEMQPKYGEENHNISINTITNIRPYGLTLWGNRTLKTVSGDGTVALNFLNTRNMLSDIKKLLYTTAKSCMFEQNSTDLWIRFKNGVEPLLRRLKSGNGISEYQIVRGATRYNGDPLTKGEIAAVIKVYPMHAVEYFELAVEINDEEVTVS